MRQENSDVGRNSSPWKGRSGGIPLRQSVSSLLSVPDEYAGWLPFALFMGMKVIRRKGIGILMTSGPPQSVHMIGALLSKVTRVPWITDFRDPYLDDVLKAEKDAGHAVVVKSARKLETYFVAQATLALTTTERFTHRPRSRYPAQGHKIFTLPSGSNPDDFSDVRIDKEERFTLSYLGTLYENRDPEPLLRVISEEIRDGHIDQQTIMIRFIGDRDEAVEKRMNNLIQRYHLSGIAERLPCVSRQHALEIMVRSHVLLLLAEDQPLAVPAKVYEYIGSGTDIIVITGEGATSDLLKEMRVGPLVQPGDIQTLKLQIRLLYKRYLSTRHCSNTALISHLCPSKYNRQTLTRELADLLDQVHYRSPRGATKKSMYRAE